MSPSQSPARLTRNQGFEIFKLIASIFVVFIHVQFPNALGIHMEALARIAVPGFFAISGFFSYQTGTDKLAKRMAHILLLTAVAIGIDLLIGCISVEFFGVYAEEFAGSSVAYLRTMMPSLQEFGRWVLIHDNPFRPHLWYLTGVLVCYVLLWIYVRFFEETKVNYTNFYLLCVFLLITNLSEGVLASAAGEVTRGSMIRSGLFLGMPMFGMGLFLGQYWQSIWQRYDLSARRLWLLLFFGLGMSLFERFSIGISDAHIGSMLSVLAILLLCAQYPRITEYTVFDRYIQAFGPISTTVYLIHLIVEDLYKLFLRDFLPAGQTEGYLRPLLVATLSLLTATLWHLLWTALKKLFKK